MVNQRLTKYNSYEIELIQSQVLNYTIPGIGYIRLNKLHLGIVAFLLISASGIYGIFEVVTLIGNTRIGLVCILFSFLLWLGTHLHIFFLVRKSNHQWLNEIKNQKWKNPFFALALSYLFPGIGHLYLKNIFTGIFVLFIFLLSISLVAKTDIWIACGQFVFSGLVAFHALKKGTKDKYTRKIGFRFLIFLCAFRIMLSTFYLISFKDIVSLHRVNTNSMEPTLKIGDVILLHKIDSTKFERGNIVVFKKEYLGYKFMSKRIIAFAGEAVSIKDGKVFINDSVLITKPFNSIYYTRGDMDSVIITNQNSIFVLGDNTENSYDSREDGSVLINDVVALETKVIFPISRIKNLLIENN